MSESGWQADRRWPGKPAVENRWGMYVRFGGEEPVWVAGEGEEVAE